MSKSGSFPVTQEDLIEARTKLERTPPTPTLTPSSTPKSTRPSTTGHGKSMAPLPPLPPRATNPSVSPTLSPTGVLEDGVSAPPSAAGSRRSSQCEARRGSVIEDLKKGVKNVTDTTLKAGHKVVSSSKQIRDDMEATTKKVKDKTVSVGAHVRVATAGATHWVAAHTPKTAKEAMEKAKGGLSIGEKFTLFAFEKITLWSRKGFTHVFMFLILAGYTAGGALLFIACEAPHEEQEKADINSERLVLLKGLWNASSTSANYSMFKIQAQNLLDPYEHQIEKSVKHGVSPDTDVRIWTFWKTMFFCSTITTTIGYGHMTPVTSAGRALTIVYALFGIPIFLILMADFGKLFTRILKAIFVFYGKIYRTTCCRKVRRHPVVKRAFSRIDYIKNFILRRKVDESEKRVKTLEEEEEEEVLRERNYFVDGSFNLPISLALVILLVYIFIGCIIYIMWETWSFFEAFYFIFVSLTTIGFGDFVPEHPGFMMATTVYLIFGLALTAMCINIIQEKLTDTFREASVKLKERFSHIMATVQSEEGDKTVGIQIKAEEGEEEGEERENV